MSIVTTVTSSSSGASPHPRIDDAIAQLRLHFPTMPDAEKLAAIQLQQACDALGVK